MIVSRCVMPFWVGLGVVLAIYFWIAFSSSAIIVWAASLSPALAARRETARTRSERPASPYAAARPCPVVTVTPALARN